MILNKESIASVFTNFRADFEAGKLAAKPIHPQLAMQVKSSSAEENYAWLGQNSSLREWIGDKHFNGLAVSSFTLKNRNFEHTISVPQNDIEDDKLGVLSSPFQMMGQDAALHPDSLLFELIQKGTGTPCYDGQYFFDTDHPADPGDPDKGGVSNLALDPQAGGVPSWYLLDTTKIVKPFILQIRKDYTFIKKDQNTDDHVFNRGEFVYGVEARLNAGFGLWQLAYASNLPLTAANVASADAAMMSIKAPTGKPLGITANVLLVSPAMKESALKLLKLETSHYRDAFELIVCPWL
ncbi:MAG: Mu-like prophage major head subunit gpT family protein [Zoogloeaceae bacterium]|jgi:phage major head subunit gpT-like protein|nr:Mu-like prophage major head subunit gpT family protein [Zoogloeaceae bacterium]